ncbi:DUF4010 domain-containing protein [Pelagibacterium flavum]|uniref:DUF4010 domain-containing protein n=1 Tax=Pelagibacterium flavum TaxID=2984530 RepID=A0ABY6ISQ8_9HYPH|nr:DUF4010 domain-containing protein [Pelagibacterium sp. YIM 151497]UYQ73439.1 DUF4010 domain-containing protein [Pelagibacterium sp. YIM 151497]
MDTLILNLGLALAIGLLVGLERGWRDRETAEGERTAGIRTYGISGLLGGVVRVTGIIIIVAPAVLGVAGIAILAAVAVFGVSGSLFLMRGRLEGDGAQVLRNPFDLPALLVFALFFAVVSTISALLAMGNTSGMVATSAISGIFEVDVAVLSALRLLGEAAHLEAVGHAVLLALTTNALGRLFVAAATGPVRFWLPIVFATLLAGAVGYAAFLTLPHFDWPGSPGVLGS